MHLRQIALSSHQETPEQPNGVGRGGPYSPRYVEDAPPLPVLLGFAKRFNIAVDRALAYRAPTNRRACSNREEKMAERLGGGEWSFEVQENWAKIPDEIVLGDCAAVGVDSHDNVYAFLSGEPFHRCTHTALSPQCDQLYISDGYGNARIHRYSIDGKLQKSWGEPGTDPGTFNIPHNICCDPDGWIYVADRENHRVQVFDGDGKW